MNNKRQQTNDNKNNNEKPTTTTEQQRRPNNVNDQTTTKQQPQTDNNKPITKKLQRKEPAVNNKLGLPKRPYDAWAVSFHHFIVFFLSCSPRNRQERLFFCTYAVFTQIRNILN